MIQIKSYADPRHNQYCAFCANFKTKLTKDHIPSKVFLNKPYPENMHIVQACHNCNNGFSIDEEYIAYWIEIAIFKETGVETERYKKTLKALRRNISLRKKILGNNLFGKDELLPIDDNRLKNILFKLASGHILFRYSNPQYKKPTYIKWGFLLSLNRRDRNKFESIPKIEVLPESGSRTIIMIDKFGQYYYPWEIVQDDVYRYLVASAENSTFVKIVLSEFIYAEVIWLRDT